MECSKAGVHQALTVNKVMLQLREEEHYKVLYARVLQTL